MDVLIVERDELVGGVIADALAVDGIFAKVVSDKEEALAVASNDVPHVVITGINRSDEDMKGLEIGRDMHARWPGLAIVYMAALWPVRLKRLCLYERFLTKPLHVSSLINTVRGLLKQPQHRRHPGNDLPSPE
jgi:DNA-binding response OmpR family regulator